MSKHVAMTPRSIKEDSSWNKRSTPHPYNSNVEMVGVIGASITVEIVSFAAIVEPIPKTYPTWSTRSPGSHKANAPTLVDSGSDVDEFVTSYKFVAFSWVIPDDPYGPTKPGIPWIPCGPAGPIGPCGPCGPWVPVWLSLLSFLSSFLSSNLLNLQNSTEDTKKPSKGPVLHSYFLSWLDIGYKSYLHICHILEPLLY